LSLFFNFFCLSSLNMDYGLIIIDKAGIIFSEPFFIHINPDLKKWLKYRPPEETNNRRKDTVK